jgi:signal transduction histidine kinase
MPAIGEGVLERPARPLRWAAIVVVLFALVGLWLSWFGHESQVQRVVEQAAQRAQAEADAADRFTQDAWSTLAAIAAAPEVRSGDLEGMRAYLHGIDAAAIGFPAGIGWVDEQGWQQVRTAPDTVGPIDFRDREHIQRALTERRPVVSSAFMGRVNASPLVAFVVPVTTTDGKPGGVIAGGFRLDRVGAEMGRSLGEMPDVVVIDAKGQVLSGTGPVHDLRAAAAAFPLAGLHGAGNGAQRLPAGPLGDEDRLVGYATAGLTDWTVLVDLPSRLAFESADATLLGRSVVIALAALLVVLVLLWVARRLDIAVREQSRAYAEEQLVRAQLQEAVARLEQRAALRDAFVGVISHELRTPVTTIYGAAKLLARSPRRPELESLVTDIEEEAARLQRITEDLLVLVRAEHDSLEVESEPIMVQRLIPGIIADLRARNPDADIRLALDEAIPPVHSDAASLGQVISNLVSNALKYGAGTPVVVRADSADDVLILRVEDGGPGLPDEDLERIFELFYRSPRNSGRAAGTGIGLFVARELVTAMGGTIHAYAVAPRGLGFALRLPGGDAGWPEDAEDLVGDTSPGVGLTAPSPVGG